MKKEKSFLILLSILVLVSLGTNFLHIRENHQQQTGVVRMNEVWENFEMRKELELQLEEKMKAMQSDLQPIESQLKELSLKEGSSRELEQLQKAYSFKKSQLEDEYNEWSTQLNAQIDTQLRAYINEFATQNKFSYIHRLDPGSSLLYAPDDQDITEEITQYINMKYQGIK